MIEMVILAALAGLALGALYFGGLWWTVRQGLASPRPALWFCLSLFLRMAAALGGFYFVSGHQWQRLLACLIGFIVARVIISRVSRPRSGPALDTTAEGSHAP